MSCYTSDVDRLAKQIGQRVAHFREKQGFTLPQFAEQFHFSKGYLSNIENGKRLPTIEMLSKIAKALGARLRDFF